MAKQTKINIIIENNKKEIEEKIAQQIRADAERIVGFPLDMEQLGVFRKNAFPENPPRSPEEIWVAILFGYPVFRRELDQVSRFPQPIPEFPVVVARTGLKNGEEYIEYEPLYKSWVEDETYDLKRSVTQRLADNVRSAMVLPPNSGGIIASSFTFSKILMRQVRQIEREFGSPRTRRIEADLSNMGVTIKDSNGRVIEFDPSDNSPTSAKPIATQWITVTDWIKQGQTFIYGAKPDRLIFDELQGNANESDKTQPEPKEPPSEWKLIDL